MKRVNKYIYGYNLQSNYGQGWETECFEYTLKEARQQLRTYRENSPYPVRIVGAREPNGCSCRWACGCRARIVGAR